LEIKMNDQENDLVIDAALKSIARYQMGGDVAHLERARDTIDDLIDHLADQVASDPHLTPYAQRCIEDDDCVICD
jgi:methyl coenzyme M reductase subunit C-like uncharacterized protein (methanogenesis marker protein 7)